MAKGPLGVAALENARRAGLGLILTLLTDGAKPHATNSQSNGPNKANGETQL
jgi:hypothetical protein